MVEILWYTFNSLRQNLSSRKEQTAVQYELFSKPLLTKILLKMVVVYISMSHTVPRLIQTKPVN